MTFNEVFEEFKKMPTADQRRLIEAGTKLLRWNNSNLLTGSKVQFKTKNGVFIAGTVVRMKRKNVEVLSLYGSEGIKRGHAGRWNVSPELCHNEVAGWGQHGDVTRQVMTLVTLRHDAEHPQVSRRFDLVADVMREVVADIVEVRAAGDGDLAQLFDLILMGDFVSLHLAGREGIDPGPIPVLGDLKAALADAAG